MLPLDIYNQRITFIQKRLTELRKKSNLIGYIRLAVALCLGIGIYMYTQFTSDINILFLITNSIVFIFLLRIHRKVKQQVTLQTELLNINQKEFAYIQGDCSGFENGEEYIDSSHSYSYDLDLFGTHSLFQHINRTSTHIGKAKLANFFNNPNKEEIIHNQKAIQELSTQIDWRQEYSAQGKLNQDSKESLQKITAWITSNSSFNKKSSFLYWSYLSPVVLTGISIGYLISNNNVLEYSLSILFLLNLSVFGLLLKQIKKKYEQLNNSSKILFTYSQLLFSIESSNFQSDKLNQLKNRLIGDNEKNTSSKALKSLSSILFQLDSMHYGIPTILANGLFLYHIHCIFKLNRWKKVYNKQILHWLDAISEFDALNSLANFSFNHPHFITPTLSKKDELVTEGLGHPLIADDKRVCNNISFSDQRFTILTGSNMSGKSTFLRTLGMNLILAKMGASVCAKQFIFYPYDVFISMRIDDSLHNNTSFFFAELHRLKKIIEHLSRQPKTFILLDEILRGTNSNDKYTGTIGLIKQLIQKNAVGIIATHDLSVTEISKEYPSYLNNKCFEVEIKNNELYFDYLLKDGVCEKMSASFLMKKLNIID